jgi:hypothetical protein
MRRRALRPSFVVTFALGAAAMAGGCSSGVVTKNPPVPSPDGSSGDGSIDGSAECPGQVPAQGASCDLPSSVSCTYGPCADAPNQSAVCQQGTWNLLFPGGCNPPIPISDAGPDVSDAGADGAGQDGGHD